MHGEAREDVPPLVLLHGGGNTVQTSFGQLLPELARTRRIIAFERQGYGHTAHVADRPFSFEQFADDTIALLDCGDSDVMRPEHAVEEYRLIPSAQLAVLPGTQHMDLTSRTEWLVPMIERFLNA